MAEGGQSLDLITPERLQQLITRIDALELESKDAWNTDGVHLLDMQLIVTDIIGEVNENQVIRIDSLFKFFVIICCSI